MGRSRRRPGGTGGTGGTDHANNGVPNGNGSVPAAGTTGRYLVLLATDDTRAGTRALAEATGVTVASTADFRGGAVEGAQIAGAGGLYFDQLGVAVVDVPPDRLRGLNALAGGESGILEVEPERIVFAIEEQVIDFTPAIVPSLPSARPVSGGMSEGGATLSLEYLIGYRDAIDHLVERLLAGGGTAALSQAPAAGPVDESSLTWGLQVTHVAASRYTGRGVKVAVLDTGFATDHPDFAGRRVVTQSFITGETVQDGHGHGTHCIGTALGSARPGQLPRYGIASNADIYAGKVLSNQGSGSDGGILAGINWAITNGCAVVSMSLGAPATVGQPYSRIYEQVARRALAAGTLIIAAAGNESNRPAQINPVGHPANCPSIMAVAALDSNLAVARFSCGGLGLQGGQVDIAGPGVAVRSSWPRPLLYRTISGTSMATPHVAGIAALYAEANPDVRGGALGWLLLQAARRLDLPARDSGAGLVQAP